MILTGAFLIESETCAPFINLGNVVTSLRRSKWYSSALPCRDFASRSKCLNVWKNREAHPLFTSFSFRCVDWRFFPWIFSRPSTPKFISGGNNGTRRVTVVETPTPFTRPLLSRNFLQPSHVSPRPLAAPCFLFTFQPTPATVDGSTPRARSSWSPPRWRAEQRGRTARTTEHSPTETAVDCASCTKRAAELSV